MRSRGPEAALSATVLSAVLCAGAAWGAGDGGAPGSADPPAVATAARAGPRRVLASGTGGVHAAVAGPISLTLRVASAAVEVLAAAGNEVRLTLQDQPAARLALITTGGDRIEAEFDGRRRLQAGKLRVEVPRGSRLDLASLDGRIAVRRVGGEVRVRASSGDIDLIGASQVDAEAIDGEIDIFDASGPVTVRTVSGAVSVSTVVSAARLRIETASGNVDWRGTCAKGCHLDADTVSGRLHFQLDRASSFTISTISHSGKLLDELGLERTPDAKASERAEREPGWHRASYGAAEGEIECESFSGDVRVSPR